MTQPLKSNHIWSGHCFGTFRFSIAIKPRCATHRLVMILQCPGPSRLAVEISWVIKIKDPQLYRRHFSTHSGFWQTSSAKRESSCEKSIFKPIPLPSTINNHSTRKPVTSLLIFSHHFLFVPSFFCWVILHFNPPLLGSHVLLPRCLYGFDAKSRSHQTWKQRTFTRDAVPLYR